MMAEKEMRNQFRSAITAATVCCRMPVSDETSSITQYLKSLLDTANFCVIYTAETANSKEQSNLFTTVAGQGLSRPCPAHLRKERQHGCHY